MQFIVMTHDNNGNSFTISVVNYNVFSVEKKMNAMHKKQSGAVMTHKGHIKEKIYR